MLKVREYYSADMDTTENDADRNQYPSVGPKTLAHNIFPAYEPIFKSISFKNINP